MRFSFSMLLALLLVGGCGGAEQPGYERAEPAQAITPDEASPDEAADLGGPAVPPGFVDRKIVYTATVDLVVEDFDPVPAEIDALLKRFDAYVAHSEILGSPGRPRHGEWVIRVPVDRYSELLAAARELGEPRSVRSDSRDVTEEYYDVEARIRNKRQEEQRLLKLLETATGELKDVLEIERELSRVREETERMEGRLRVLQDTTSLTTVTLRIEEIENYVPPEVAGYGTRARRAWEQSLSALLATVQTASLVAVALLPWAAVVFVLGLPVFLLRRLFRSGRKSPFSVPAAVITSDEDRTTSAGDEKR